MHFIFYNTLQKATWVFGPVVIPLPKKPYLSMRVWVRSTIFSKYTCVCEFILEFLSYIYIYIYTLLCCLCRVSSMLDPLFSCESHNPYFWYGNTIVNHIAVQEISVIVLDCTTFSFFSQVLIVLLNQYVLM